MLASPLTRSRVPVSKSMNKSPTLRIHAQVADGTEHAVAVEDGERQRGVVDHPHEAWVPPL